MASTLDMGRIEQAISRTHKLARPSWFPLAAFGLLVLLISPLYTSGPPPWGLRGARHMAPASPWLPGITMGSDPWFPSLAWIMGLTVAGGASFAYYRRRAVRVGVSSRILPALGAGAGVLIILVISSPGAAGVTGWYWPYRQIARVAPDLLFRGTAPLLCIGIVVGILAALERSRALGMFAVGFMGLVLLVSLYDIQNVFYRIHLDVAAPAINLILPGVALVGAALVSGVTREVP